MTINKSFIAFVFCFVTYLSAGQDTTTKFFAATYKVGFISIPSINYVLDDYNNTLPGVKSKFNKIRIVNGYSLAYNKLTKNGKYSLEGQFQSMSAKTQIILPLSGTNDQVINLKYNNIGFLFLIGQKLPRPILKMASEHYGVITGVGMTIMSGQRFNSNSTNKPDLQLIDRKLSIPIGLFYQFSAPLLKNIDYGFRLSGMYELNNQNWVKLYPYIKPGNNGFLINEDKYKSHSIILQLEGRISLNLEFLFN
ncbi:MAG: hypothetical protein SGJ04_08730 [Bacteroidota bacterium]|nr:hypothetical protein [Bacteroidota bacterium]